MQRGSVSIVAHGIQVNIRRLEWTSGEAGHGVPALVGEYDNVWRMAYVRGPEGSLSTSPSASTRPSPPQVGAVLPSTAASDRHASSWRCSALPAVSRETSGELRGVVDFCGLGGPPSTLAARPDNDNGAESLQCGGKLSALSTSDCGRAVARHIQRSAAGRCPQPLSGCCLALASVTSLVAENYRSRKTAASSACARSSTTDPPLPYELLSL